VPVLALLAVIGRVVVVDRADAARVPLRSERVVSHDEPTDAVPLVLAKDDFDGDPRTNLAARVADTGQPWQVRAGRFVADGTGVRGGGQSAATATVDATRARVSVAATLTFPSGPGPRRAGFVLHAQDSGQEQLQVLYDAIARTVELRRVTASGSPTVLATRTVAVAEPDQPARVTVTTDGATVRVASDRWGSAPVATFVLSAADQDRFADNRDFGIVSDGDAETRFDDFEVRR
jgi:hypothetical protein